MDRVVIAGLDNIAQAMGCSRKTLYKWIRNKGFPAFKMDGTWRAMPHELRDWTAAQRQALRQGAEARP